MLSLGFGLELVLTYAVLARAIRPASGIRRREYLDPFGVICMRVCVCRSGRKIRFSYSTAVFLIVVLGMLLV